MGLFKKAALFTDIHFGAHLDSETHNQDCLEFIEWFVEQVKLKICDTVIFLGDYHHNRVRTENRTGFYSRVGVELLDALHLPVYWLLGNHELYLRNSRDIHSLQHLGRYRNIKLIDTLSNIDDVVFAPWLISDEHEKLVEHQCKYIFGHFELPFFLMNQVVEKVWDGHGLRIDDFKKCDAVYSGHFHKRQVRINQSNIPVHYIGNCFGHDMNDVNDPARGMAILDWGETLPTYVPWPNAPTYHRYAMSEFLKKLQSDDASLYGPRSTVELIDNMSLPAETIAQLKEVVECRRLHIRKPKQQIDQLSESSTPQYTSIDELVENTLRTMSYDGKFDPSLLCDIYKCV